MLDTRLNDWKGFEDYILQSWRGFEDCKLCFWKDILHSPVAHKGPADDGKRLDSLSPAMDVAYNHQINYK